MNQKTRMDHTLITTNIQLDGYRVMKNLGVVRGIIVRSRSLLGNIGLDFRFFSEATSASTPSCASRLAGMHTNL